MNSFLSQSIDELWFLKMLGSLVFLWNQSIKSFIQMSEMNLWCPIIKRKGIIMWIRVYPYWKMNCNSKNGKKRSSSYESKASISFIPKRRMNLWCPIIERKEITTWIQVYPKWKMSFSSKNGRKRSFCYETKASISLIPIRRMCLWLPIME